VGENGNEFGRKFGVCSMLIDYSGMKRCDNAWAWGGGCAGHGG
jgi:hypothetical protein